MQNEESEPLNRKWKNSFINESGEESITITPRKVSFACEHYYTDLGLDDEGYYQVECRMCHTGKRYDHENLEVIGGKLCQRK